MFSVVLSSDQWTKLTIPKIIRYVIYYKRKKKIFFLQHMKMSNPKEIEELEIEIEKLELEKT